MTTLCCAGTHSPKEEGCCVYSLQSNGVLMDSIHGFAKSPGYSVLPTVVLQGQGREIKDSPVLKVEYGLLGSIPRISDSLDIG